MNHRFWPITISGAAAVFVAGFMTALAVGAYRVGSSSHVLVFLLMVYLLLYHAADTARTSLLNGSYSKGWFGIRSAVVDHETTVSPLPEQVSK